MNVLVTGGAGYIGSHAAKKLIESGHRVVVLDNLERGHREAVPGDAAFEGLDLRQTEAVTNALGQVVLMNSAFAWSKSCSSGGILFQ